MKHSQEIREFVYNYLQAKPISCEAVPSSTDRKKRQTGMQEDKQEDSQASRKTRTQVADQKTIRMVQVSRQEVGAKQ